MEAADEPTAPGRGCRRRSRRIPMPPKIVAAGRRVGRDRAVRQRRQTCATLASPPASWVRWSLSARIPVHHTYNPGDHPHVRPSKPRPFSLEQMRAQGSAGNDGPCAAIPLPMRGGIVLAMKCTPPCALPGVAGRHRATGRRLMAAHRPGFDWFAGFDFLQGIRRVPDKLEMRPVAGLSVTPVDGMVSVRHSVIRRYQAAARAASEVIHTNLGDSVQGRDIIPNSLASAVRSVESASASMNLTHDPLSGRLSVDLREAIRYLEHWLKKSEAIVDGVATACQRFEQAEVALHEMLRNVTPQDPGAPTPERIAVPLKPGAGRGVAHGLRSDVRPKDRARHAEVRRRGDAGDGRRSDHVADESGVIDMADTVTENAAAAAATPANGAPDERAAAAQQPDNRSYPERWAAEREAEKQAKSVALPASEQRRLARTRELTGGQKLTPEDRDNKLAELRAIIARNESPEERAAFANATLDDQRKIAGVRAPDEVVLPKFYQEQYVERYGGWESDFITAARDNGLDPKL